MYEALGRYVLFQLLLSLTAFFTIWEAYPLIATLVIASLRGFFFGILMVY
ncbi:MAG: hypothetical protein KQH63_22225 [Desulfobulbaceae bacterium]|nr:hypothetical protein [Desulfobulbaceae bacterium]